MPGLLEQIPPIVVPPAPDPYATQAAQAQQATAVGYQANPFTVGTNQTVAGQLENIIAKDSPLMQQAERRARQAMNERGLLNSSIAVGAGQEAVLGAATPIATADAGTFDRAMTNTVNAQNAAAHFRAGAENQTSLANAQLGTNVNLANTEAANKAQSEAFQSRSAHSLAGVDANTRMALAQMDANTRTQLATIDGQYRQLLQSNQNAASMFNQVAGNIAQISQSTTLDQTGKDNAINSQLNMLNEALRTTAAIGATPGSAVGSLNLGQYFTTPAGVLNQPGAVNANGSVPEGGWRDAQGNVYYPDGTLAPWRGPVNQAYGTPRGGGTASPSAPPPATALPPSPAPVGAPAGSGTYAPATQPTGAQGFGNDVQYISGLPILVSSLQYDAYGNRTGINVTTGEREQLF